MRIRSAYRDYFLAHPEAKSWIKTKLFQEEIRPDLSVRYAFKDVEDGSLELQGINEGLTSKADNVIEIHAYDTEDDIYAYCYALLPLKFK